MKSVHPSLNRRLLASAPALLATTALLGAVNLVARFPGETNPDSDDQYRQLLSGQYSDWHPPVMARLWRLLHVFGDGAGPIFAVHVMLYWLGFGLLATTLVKGRRPVAAWCVLGIGALPPLLMLNINIAKDIGLGVALLCSFAVCHAFRRRGDSIPAWAVLVATLLIGYAALVRGNAVFAVGPLIWYAWSRRPWRRPIVAITAFSLAVAVLLVPTSTFVNRHLLAAAPGGAIESLQFFDVAGTARLAHDDGLFGGQPLPAAELHRCYSPIMWDTLPQRCPALWSGVSGPVLGGQGGTAGQPPLSSLWIDALRRHPGAYLAHRLLAFNATLYLYVPPHHTEYVRLLDTAGTRSQRLTARVLDGLRYNWFTAPATMLALAGVLLVLVGGSGAPADADRDGATILLLSAVLYTLSFLPFGVATDLRYFFWPTIAVLVAAILAAPTVAAAFRADRLRLAAICSPVTVVLLLIAVSRLREDASLLML